MQFLWSFLRLAWQIYGSLYKNPVLTFWAENCFVNPIFLCPNGWEMSPCANYYNCNYYYNDYNYWPMVESQLEPQKQGDTTCESYRKAKWIFKVYNANKSESLTSSWDPLKSISPIQCVKLIHQHKHIQICTFLYPSTNCLFVKCL